MKTPAKSFTDLAVWQNAHAMVLEIYRLTEGFPVHERFGLTGQLRRAAVSVPANIAEGFRKFSSADKARYVNIAEGSLEESRYYCILARELGYAETASVLERMDAVAGQLAAFARRLRQAGEKR